MLWPNSVPTYSILNRYFVYFMEFSLFRIFEFSGIRFFAYIFDFTLIFNFPQANWELSGHVDVDAVGATYKKFKFDKIVAVTGT